MAGDTEEASWMPESERKTWEDYLCPVYNKQLREQEIIASIPSRFNGYHKLPATYYRTLKDGYKQEDHNIKVAIWVPKRPGENKCPVLVKFHGGGLV
jgi:acetyl esterase/lipase